MLQKVSQSVKWPRTGPRQKWQQRHVAGSVCVAVLSDSKLAVQWASGMWDVRSHAYRGPGCTLLRLVERSFCADWARHIYRKLNSEADALARMRGDDLHISSGLLLVGSRGMRCAHFLMEATRRARRAVGGVCT